MKPKFRPVSMRSAPRKTLAITRFGGVDLTSPKFSIKDGKAVDSLNYIFKDNVLQKRNGFEELFKVKPFSYVRKDFDGDIDLTARVNDVNFNGLWNFIAEDGKKHTIAHIGKLLYELKDNEEPKPLLYQDTKVKVEGGLFYNVVYEYENYKSQAFVGDYKLWFLGGNKFMCIRFLIDGQIKVEPVEDNVELAFIPTTTISIRYNDSKVGGRHSLDYVNLLTMYRKNKLISGTFKKETLDNATTFYEYPLDSPLITKNGEKDMSRFHITLEERGVIADGDN